MISTNAGVRTALALVHPCILAMSPRQLQPRCTVERVFGLTEQQRAAVAHDGGHLLIVAGAGSGKTTTLASRLAALVTAAWRPSGSCSSRSAGAAAAELLRQGRGRSGTRCGPPHVGWHVPCGRQPACCAGTAGRSASIPRSRCSTRRTPRTCSRWCARSCPTRPRRARPARRPRQEGHDGSRS